jgi:hypothetical protein
MQQSSSSTSSWKYAAIPTTVILFLALYPQLSLIVSRGSAWNGTFYVSNYDETAYATYVNALINGNPRKADPFAGNENASYESLYSIQFIPAYAVALPARMLGLSTSTAFILLTFFIAVGTSLGLFWLIRSITGNDLLSASGTLFVLCMGTAAAYEGELRHLINGAVVIDYLPFLRRYQPGLMFPAFIIYLGTVWKVISAEKLKTAAIYSAAAGVLIAILVFSYFFLWTAAVAVFAASAAISMVLNAESRSRVAVSSIIAGVISAVALIPYYMLLRQRSPEIDSIQLLNETHAPDLTASVVVLGLALVVLAIVFVRRGILELRSPLLVFIIATSVTPLMLLNQQVVTGRSLQPVHFEIFVANYVVLISAVLLLSALMRSTSAERHGVIRKALVYVALVSTAWGVVEAAGSASRNIATAQIRDRVTAAIKIAERDSHDPRNTIVLTADMISADFLGSVSQMRSLWSPHSSSGGGLSVDANRQLFFKYLYLNGVTSDDLGHALRSHVFEVTAAVFGSERALPELGIGGHAIRNDEIEQAVSRYGSYSLDTNGPMPHYLIVPNGADTDLRNIESVRSTEQIGEVEGFRVLRLSGR